MLSSPSHIKSVETCVCRLLIKETLLKINMLFFLLWWQLLFNDHCKDPLIMAPCWNKSQASSSKRNQATICMTELCNKSWSFIVWKRESMKVRPIAYECTICCKSIRIFFRKVMRLITHQKTNFITYFFKENISKML